VVQILSPRPLFPGGRKEAQEGGTRASMIEWTEQATRQLDQAHDSICAQNELPVSGYCRYKGKPFGLDDQVHGDRATISAAQWGIAGGVGGDLQGPGRILNLYRQCLTFGEQPVDPRTFDIQRFEMIIAARNGQPETPHV